MNNLILPLFLFFSMSAFGENESAFTGQYPMSSKGGQVDTFFGKQVTDPYRWLEDDRSPETMKWVKAQNAVTETYLKQIPFRDALRKRLTTLWNYEKFSAPFKEGKFTYFYKNDGLQNQSVLFRQQDQGAPEMFLDPNAFSTDGTSSLAGISFSADGTLCAYQISEGGSDWTKAVIMDAQTKKELGPPLTNLKFSGVSWLGNKGFYYSTYDVPTGSQLSAKTEHHKLMWHALGTAQGEDKVVFGGEKMPRRYISGGVTEDENFLVISASNATYGNELYIKNLKLENAPLIPIVEGFKTEQRVLHAELGMLYLSTDMDAPNRRLVVVEAGEPQPGNWKTIIPEKEFPLSASACGGKIFAHYLQDAVSKVYQHDLEGKVEHELVLPGLGSASGFSGKRDDEELYYSFTSYVHPPTIFHYQISSSTSHLYKKSAVKFSPELYESRQVFYKSKDGTRVPMIITSKKGLSLDGNNPTLLYGYGGFRISLTPSFSVSNLAFMENGGIYAVANIRGGGEYGKKWHDAGTKLSKQNVFDDFICAAEFLISEKYTSSKCLAISGGSNGGLLVGACIIQRPELFRVAFPQVGVLDMLRYHKFTAGAGWSYDYGTSDDSQESFDYLYKYSPVHNVKHGTRYPATMVLTGDHDDRVVPAHSFKFTAALQAAQSGKNPTLIRIETKAGHGAGKPTTMVIDELADKWAFLFWNMGIPYKIQ